MVGHDKGIDVCGKEGSDYGCFDSGVNGLDVDCNEGLIEGVGDGFDDGVTISSEVGARIGMSEILGS